MIMQHITLCTPCITFLLVSHTRIFVIDHPEPKFEEPTEQAQAEDLTKLALDQDKHQCI
jgi:hypothetical protein